MDEEEKRKGRNIFVPDPWKMDASAEYLDFAIDLTYGNPFSTYLV